MNLRILKNINSTLSYPILFKLINFFLQLQPYKVERDLVAGHDLSRLALPPSLPAALPHNLPHIEPYSSPRDQSSAGSCGTPDPRTPVTPRPASQQERYN